MFSAPKTKIGDRIVLVLEDMGPVFIKAGQILSTRPDIVGYSIANSLANLQDKVPQFSGKKARHIIEKEFGKNISEIFSNFEENAAAAASIAQVHKALDTNNKYLAVKILRPGIEKRAMSDLAFLHSVIKIGEFLFPSLRRLQLKQMIQRIKKNMLAELNLNFEAAYSSRIKENLVNSPRVRTPEIIWNLVSKKVLTMEWIDGYSSLNRTLMIKNGINPKEIYSSLAIAFFNQAYGNGFFHGDLHPGNILIDKNHNIVLIDFGIVGSLSEETRLYLAEIMRGFIKRDYEAVARAHSDAGYLPTEESIERFTAACYLIGEPIAGRSSSEISVAKLLTHLFSVTEAFNIQINPELLLFHKSLMLLEGACSKLDPNANLWIIAEPWIKEWAKNNMNSKQKIKRKTRDFIRNFSAINRSIAMLANNYELQTSWNNKNINKKKQKTSILIFIIIIMLVISIRNENAIRDTLSKISFTLEEKTVLSYQ